MRAIRALAAIDAAPFGLVFGGGTALARAHRIVRRVSGDVDFKIVPLAAVSPLSRSTLRRQLEHSRQSVSTVLRAGGFAFDTRDRTVTWARDEGRYSVWQLPYGAFGEAGEGLRPAIKVELNYAPMRRPAVMLPVMTMAPALWRHREVRNRPALAGSAANFLGPRVQFDL